MSSNDNLKYCESADVGDCFLAKASEDGIWYRAEVSSVSEKAVKVLYVDYGNTESLSLTDTLPVPAHLARLRRQALNYQLCTTSGDTFETWPEEAFSKFEDLVRSSEYLTGTVARLSDDRTVVSLRSNTCEDFADNIR